MHKLKKEFLTCKISKCFRKKAEFKCFAMHDCPEGGRNTLIDYVNRSAFKNLRLLVMQIIIAVLFLFCAC